VRSTRVWIAAAVSLVVAVGGLSASARGEPAGNPVTEWNLFAASTLGAFPAAASGASPALLINIGMTQGAVYDAVNASPVRMLASRAWRGALAGYNHRSAGANRSSREVTSCNVPGYVGRSL
jgi:hypothetical protein